MHLGLLLYPYTTQMCHRHLSRQRNSLHLLLIVPWDLLLCQTLKAKETETEWFDKVMAAQLNRMDWISWSAYHASIQTIAIPPSAIIALLPLFMDSVHSVAMMKHSMTIVQATVQHLNPSQVPVVIADQPLFALAKQIQWPWPNQFGESLFVMHAADAVKKGHRKLCVRMEDTDVVVNAIAMFNQINPDELC